MHYRKGKLYQSKILGIVKVITNNFFLRFNSESKACILNWNLGKESSCEKYQVYKDYNFPQGKIGLMEKKSLF